MHKVEILGVRLDPLRLDEVLALIGRTIDSSGRALIANVNVRALYLAHQHPWFGEFLNNADLVFCDGMGVQIGARWLGYSIPERFTLADWMFPLTEMACAKEYSFFFLGNPAGVAERAAARLQERFPTVHIVGSRHGFFDKAPGSVENEAVIAQINAARPDILLVGFGMPLQEEWLSQNWPRLEARVALPCGALFEYLSGDLKRGPRWMTQHYLEWLARVIISPRRYARRYLYENICFLYWVARQKFKGRPIETTR